MKPKPHELPACLAACGWRWFTPALWCRAACCRRGFANIAMPRWRGSTQAAMLPTLCSTQTFDPKLVMSEAPGLCACSPVGARLAKALGRRGQGPEVLATRREGHRRDLLPDARFRPAEEKFRPTPTSSSRRAVPPRAGALFQTSGLAQRRRLLPDARCRPASAPSFRLHRAV